jgi:DNA polymerase III subunit epsilon
LIDMGAGDTIGGIVTRVDLTAFTLPVLLANDQESAAHEEVLKQLDKASGGKTLWRIEPSRAVA